MHCNALVMANGDEDCSLILGEAVDRGIDYYDEEYKDRNEGCGIVLKKEALNKYEAYNDTYTFEGKEYVVEAKSEDVDFEETIKNIYCVITYRTCIYEFDFRKNDDDWEDARKEFEKFAKLMFEHSDNVLIADIHI